MAKLWILTFAVFCIGVTIREVESKNIIACDKWGVKFTEGQKITVPEQCMLATCLDGQENDVALSMCPQFKIRAECYLGKENLKEAYPNCCPQPVCPRGG